MTGELLGLAASAFQLGSLLTLAYVVRVLRAELSAWRELRSLQALGAGGNVRSH